MMQGHIAPQWDLDYIKNLDYIDSNYNSKKFNALNNLVDHEDLTRYQIVLGQVQDQETNPALSFIHHDFNWITNKKCQINKLTPGNVIPKHSDVYNYYNKKYNIIDNSKIFRILIMIEDWQSGHYLEIKDRGFTNWQAGDWVGFRLSDPHMTANLGHTNRYVIQITGTI